MRKKREARAANGDLITHCPGCAAWPVHSSWLEACERCGLNVCRVCREEHCACPPANRSAA